MSFGRPRNRRLARRTGSRFSPLSGSPFFTRSTGTNWNPRWFQVLVVCASMMFVAWAIHWLAGRLAELMGKE